MDECETALLNNYNNNNNYALITVCIILKKYIFNMINSWSVNLNSVKRFNEVTKCLVSSEFMEIHDDRIQVDIKRKINLLYSSMCCICFNKNQMKKNNDFIKFYIGGTNIKLSHPSYYAIKHKKLIEDFNKGSLKKISESDNIILLRFIESSVMEYILNKKDSSIDLYNKNSFFGSGCNDGKIVANEIINKNKCPQKYYLLYKNEKITNITADNIDDLYLYSKKKVSCKQSHDAEIDCLLAIIREKMIGSNIYEKSDNLWNFVKHHFLNINDDEYIGNYGFFSINKCYYAETPCWICANWLEQYGCNYFNCGQGLLKKIYNAKIPYDQWLPENSYSFTDLLSNKNLNLKIMTSLCDLKYNVNLTEKKLLNSKRVQKYKRLVHLSYYGIYDLIDIMLTYNDFKINNARKVSDLKIKNINVLIDNIARRYAQGTIVKMTDNDYNDIITTLSKHNKTLNKLIYLKMCKFIKILELSYDL
jgi:hypothetical protein